MRKEGLKSAVELNHLKAGQQKGGSEKGWKWKLLTGTSEEGSKETP